MSARLRLPAPSALALGAALTLLAAAAHGQEVRAEVDSTRVGVEDEVELTVTVEGSSLRLSGDVVELPVLTNLRALGGPSVATQVSIVNGSLSQSRVYTWVLQPLRPGHAEVGPVKVNVGGTDKQTAPISIEVVAGRARPRAAPTPDPMDPFASDPFFQDPFGMLGGRAQRGRAGPEPKLRLQAVPSRTRLRVGESLVLTYALYTQASVSDLQFTDGPQYPGFWAEDLDRGNVSGGESATLDGEAYRRFVFLKKLLFPTRAGTLTIPAAQVRMALQRLNPFDPGGSRQLGTQALTITVDPLPDEPGFSGAVGRFEAQAALDKDHLALGEAATLRFTVRGTGNLRWIDRGPEVAVAGAKVYPPQVKTDVSTTPEGLTGSRTWEFVIVPETAGELRVPALSFAYFDPAAGRVARVETAPLALTVAPGSGGTAAAPAPGPPPAFGAGGLALRSDLEPPSRALPVVTGRTVAVGLSALAALHLALFAGGRLWERRGRGPGQGPGRRHTRHALGELTRAARGGLSKEAAAAVIESALVEVFGVVDEGAPPAGAREQAARALLQEVQFIRYAPQLGDYTEKIREVARKAEDLVRSAG